MRNYDVAAYVWPAYTGDEERSRMFWPEGMGEWQSVKNAVKNRPDHDWPRKPLWGYVNEADSRVMEMQIDTAADYGVNVFIYDWYWYDGRPFLEKCLNEGFLKARNRSRMKFYLMWANHDVKHTWDIRMSWDQEDTIWKGTVDRNEFEKVGRRLTEKYFKQPNYYCIDGKPVLMIYDLRNLIKGLGGIEKTKEALEWLKEEVRREGFAGLHLQLVSRGSSENLSGVDGTDKVYSEKEIAEILGILRFDSCTHYQFAQYTAVSRDYLEILEDMKREWERLESTGRIPYYPHVSVGWDNNPRFVEYKDAVCRNNGPENFEKGLRLAKAYVDAHPEQVPLVTVNSWNEWTETSYLEPDDRNGYGYLEAVRRVFLEE